MAKILVTRRDHRPLRLSPHVRMVRERYARALQLGYSVAEASRLSGSDEEIVKPVSRKPVEPAIGSVVETVTPLAERPAPDLAPFSISGRAEKISRDNIPPNWQDLPWPQLRKLATEIAPTEKVQSRAVANQIIENAVRGG